MNGREGHGVFATQRQHVRQVLYATAGTTAIDYALIASLIAMAIVGSVRALGANFPGMLNVLVNTLG